mmetsp:Transcript_4622/g.12845  ORF Transcript_4622/g.12845 Transcript_4622/m.12845 type:complete len:206 (+) Transcript_4622:2-619(+)
MDSRRSNIEMSRPPFCASWLRTVAGNWHWSPTMTACTAPLPRGKITAGSMTCAASSTTMKGNFILSSGPIPQPMHVAHTTSIVSMTILMPLSPRLAPHSASRASSEYGLSAGHRPILSTRTPKLCKPSAKLSVPRFEKELARIGPRPVRNHPHIRATDDVVLPVPGGPWMRLKRRLWSKTSCTDCRCEALRRGPAASPGTGPLAE